MTDPDAFLRTTYGIFNTGELDRMAERFGHGAHYNQVDGQRSWNGRGQIRKVFAAWQTCFVGAWIENVSIKPASESDLAQEIGAAHCRLVDYILVGVYAQAFPGLEGTAPATGRQVILRVGETVWLNDFEIVRVDNTVGLVDLR